MKNRLKYSNKAQKSEKIYKIRLKKGDIVTVLAGSDKGKTGKVLELHPKDNKVTVAGINVVKKHLKPSRTNTQGGIVELTKAIWVSKVGLVDPTTKKTSRIKYSVAKDGTKTRTYSKSGKEIK